MSSSTTPKVSYSLGWSRAIPYDINDAGYHIFEVDHQGRLLRLQVLVIKEGRLWKTDWALATSLRPPQILAEHTVKTRRNPKFDNDCAQAKKWAEGFLLSPLALLAQGLTSVE